MPDLYFPQLTSGAAAQYPIRKARVMRTIKNVFADGSMLVAEDLGSGHLSWQLSYVDLSLIETQALEDHFTACAGPFRAFTFIDPTANMLVSSGDFTAQPWLNSGLIGMQSGVADPAGGSAGVTATNSSAVTQEISQTLQVPANYRYCFSLYAFSALPSVLTLIRRGTNVQQAAVCQLSSTWSRIVATGQLVDSGTAFSVAVSLTPGQSVSLYGPQLEAQIAPSSYRPTYTVGGVYPNAHWAVEELIITAEAPNLFSTSFSIETPV